MYRSGQTTDQGHWLTALSTPTESPDRWCHSFWQRVADCRSGDCGSMRAAQRRALVGGLQKVQRRTLQRVVWLLRGARGGRLSRARRATSRVAVREADPYDTVRFHGLITSLAGQRCQSTRLAAMKQLSLLLSNSPAPSCTFVDVHEGGGRGRLGRGWKELSLCF